ncbi:MAG TPA: bifunctional diaminohydroxyphosphoribosylaminopyrimidine deaminase/5-amino-6-(5-phosphoribosylamino)uracil reductase RibD [Bacteroidia bacterium]|nr:bifunctional diaminohydroxyphosphoribosylaminopyrimidine deaminase/5-amino-6-(5-phosphoribosylamino)uracil reductase RibD [Bacteroidia bacterium]
MNDFNQYMQRCLELAAKGLGSVAPNPMVGCVIVHNNVIIGEGYHQKYGEAHAEVNAIASVVNKNLLAESTVYVNLEPCSHYGKTPPCSDLLIEHKIKRVVVACLDTNPLVAGKGIEKLRNAGIEVFTGVLEKEAYELNKRFFTYHEKKRPYIILKWAQTKDNFISKFPPFIREENWITNNESKKLVHTWRAQEQAILVGTTTALLDNPALTVRLTEGKSPIRILIDKELKVPFINPIFSNAAETIVITEKKEVSVNNVTYHQIDFTKEITPQILNYLYDKKVTSVIIEGGRHTLQSFIDRGLWDEARIFTGNKYFQSGIKAPVINKSKSNSQMIGDDELAVFTQ